jgi:hypothetical protein
MEVEWFGVDEFGFAACVRGFKNAAAAAGLSDHVPVKRDYYPPFSLDAAKVAESHGKLSQCAGPHRQQVEERMASLSGQQNMKMH